MAKFKLWPQYIHLLIMLELVNMLVATSDTVFVSVGVGTSLVANSL